MDESVPVYTPRLLLLTLRSTALVELGSPKEAQPLLDQAKEIADSSGSQELVALCIICQALVDLAEKNADSALRLAQEAFDVFKKGNALFEQAIVLRVIGRAYYALHQDDLAHRSFEASRGIFKSIGNEHMLHVNARDTIFKTDSASLKRQGPGCKV